MDYSDIRSAAIRLNRGQRRGSAKLLAEVMGVSVQLARAWMSDPANSSSHRPMTRGARRLLATMLLLDGAGLLNEKLIAAVDTAERLLKDGDARLNQMIEALQASLPLDETDEDEEG